MTVHTSGSPQSALVARINNEATVVIPFEATSDARIGDRVSLVGPIRLRPHPGWKGRVVNALGFPIDGGPPLPVGSSAIPIDRSAPRALNRGPIGAGIRTGVTVIDLFMPICAGQRLGLFAGSGVGKSTLLAMLSRTQNASVVVLALIGERGREVNEFLNKTLAGARQNVIAVIATSDDSTTMRRLAPRTAMAIAEYFRGLGHHVLLIMDSLTRFALAQRDYAMAAGELPVARGYPPSVFQELAALLERAGPGEDQQGLITLIATVLVDGDNHNDPVADNVRGIVDGHVVLDRAIGSSGRWPAINILESLSRLADKAWSKEEADLSRSARQLLEIYESTKDLRSFGEYRPGNDPQLDRAVAVVPQIYRALTQFPEDPPLANPFDTLRSLMTPTQPPPVMALNANAMSAPSARSPS